MYPNHVAVSPSNKLPNTYRQNIPMRCCCSIAKLSNEKAENVVNPPQIPAARNSRQLLAKASFFKANANTAPIIKLPMMLTRNVATGKDECLNQTENKYRNMLPAAPPKPTSKMFLSINKKLGDSIQNLEVNWFDLFFFYLLYSKFFTNFP